MMINNAINIDTDVDWAKLPVHIGRCLSDESASKVVVDDVFVRFSHRTWLVSHGWDLLMPFGEGNLRVDPSARQVAYCLSLKQLMMLCAILWGSLGLLFAASTQSWLALAIGPFAWLWTVLGNAAIGVLRFHWFVKRAVASAPRV